MSSDRAGRPTRALTLLVTGAEGMLAHAVRAEAAVRGHRVFAFSRRELDVTDRASVHRVLAAARPYAVVQCAAVADVDAAEGDPDRAYAVNAEGSAAVAELCAGIGARFVYPSTDYVFSGDATRPYRPDDPIAPVSVYARSKAAGEEAALRNGDGLVVRTSWLFGGGGARDFVASVLRRARAGEPLRAADDQRTSPSWTPDAASMILGLLEAGAPPGIYHTCNKGDASRYEQACAVLELAGIDLPIQRVRTADVTGPAPRPRYSVMDCSATEAIVGPIPHWRAALEKAILAGI